MVYSHRIKKTMFLNRPVSVVLQNENGPCPLLAIANVLILQGALHIHPDRSEITSDQLIEMIGHHIIERNPPLEDEELRENQQKTIDDILSILPTLQHGLDVNVKFVDVNSFEYDARISVFDMVGVHLYHGWLADPNDEQTYDIISKYSYNQLVDRIIMADDKVTRAKSRKQREIEAQKASEVVKVDEKVEKLINEQDVLEESQKNPSKEEETQEAKKNEEATTKEESVQEASGEQEKLKIDEHETEENDEETIALKKEAETAQRFLSETASQLTYLGLSELHTKVKERNLCVFFRNNHFSTMFRINGELYLLLTDQGYEKQDAVAWEKLNEINGDTELVSPEFGDPNAYAFISEDLSSNDPDRQLALQLQRMENENARTQQRASDPEADRDRFIEEQRIALAQFQKKKKAETAPSKAKGNSGKSEGSPSKGSGSNNCLVS